MNETAAMVDDCLVCGEKVSPKLNLVSAETNESFDVLVCENCGLGQTSPEPVDLDKYYEDYHGGRHGFTARFRAWIRARTLIRCFDKVAGRSILDVGCGDGDFLVAARRSGWNVVGTERGERLFEIDSLKVLPDLAAVVAEFGESSFDAVSCWHTLEHFNDPNATLADIGKLLKSDGVLLIAVPNFGGWQSRLFGRNWLHLDVPRHLWHFTQDSLNRLLSQHGFEVKRSWHREFEYDVLGWSQSCLNAIFQTPNIFFHILSGKRSEAGAFSKSANFALGFVFSAFSLPLVLVSSLTGRGGTLVVVSTRFDNNGQSSAQ